MKVICYGDSNTYGFDPRSFFGSRYSAENRWTDILANRTGWEIINQGINGQETPRADISFPDDVDLLIVMLGTNDLLQGRSYEETAMRMESLLKTLSTQNLLLIAPPPLQLGEWVSDSSLIEESKMLANEYRCLSERYDVLFADAADWSVDLVFDGVHFSEKGHHTFADGLYHYLINAGFVGRGLV